MFDSKKCEVGVKSTMMQYNDKSNVKTIDEEAELVNTVAMWTLREQSDTHEEHASDPEERGFDEIWQSFRLHFVIHFVIQACKAVLWACVWCGIVGRGILNMLDFQRKHRTNTGGHQHALICNANVNLLVGDEHGVEVSLCLFVLQERAAFETPTCHGGDSIFASQSFLYSDTTLFPLYIDPSSSSSARLLH